MLRNHGDEVNRTVWVRRVIVAASAVLTVRFAAGAARGERRSYLRLQIITTVMPVAVLVLIALPELAARTQLSRDG